MVWVGAVQRLEFIRIATCQLLTTLWLLWCLAASWLHVVGGIIWSEFRGSPKTAYWKRQRIETPKVSWISDQKVMRFQRLHQFLVKKFGEKSDEIPLALSICTKKKWNSLGFSDFGWKEKLRNSLGVIDSLRVKDRWKSVGAVNFGEKVVKFHRSHFWIKTLRFRRFWTKSNKMRKFRQFRMKRCWNSYAQAQWSGAEPLSYMIRL